MYKVQKANKQWERNYIKLKKKVLTKRRKTKK